MKKIVLTFICHCLFISLCFSQKTPAISLTFFNESFGLSPIGGNYPAHLGGTIAIDFLKKEKAVYRKFHSIQLGYFRHAPVFQSVFLVWKPKYEWQFKNGLQIHGLTGLGYLHALPTQTTFKLNGEIYNPETNYGKPSATASAGFGIGYQFGKNANQPLTVFFRQEWMLIAPFSIYTDIPVGINALFGVGVSFQFK